MELEVGCDWSRGIVILGFKDLKTFLEIRMLAKTGQTSEAVDVMIREESSVFPANTRLQTVKSNKSEGWLLVRGNGQTLYIKYMPPK